MSALENEKTMPDTEEERTTREKLRTASIDASGKPVSSDDGALRKKSETSVTQNGTLEEDGGRGRVQRKRSFDESEAADTVEASISRHGSIRHGRKRSRDSAVDDKAGSARASGEHARSDAGSDDAALNGKRSLESIRAKTPTPEQVDELEQEIASPKSKKSRVGDKKAESASDPVAVSDAQEKPDAVAITEAEPARKTANIVSGHQSMLLFYANISTQSTKTLSGTTDISAASSFSNIVSPKSESLQPQTSSSAFASSAFGALSGTSSAFGSLGGAKPLSSFASPSASTEAEKPAAQQSAPSAFGGSLGSTSSFASAGGSAFGGKAGFGSIGGTFGSGFGAASGQKLSSFASPAGGDMKPSNKAPRAFGASNNDKVEDEGGESSDEDENAEGVKSPVHDEERQDERFQKQTRESLPSLSNLTY